MSKLFYVDNHIFDNSNNEFSTSSRSTVIIPSLVGKTISVHNGRKFIPVVIKSDMLGFKLGEFVPTKITPIYKRNKRKINK